MFPETAVSPRAISTSLPKTFVLAPVNQLLASGGCGIGKSKHISIAHFILDQLVEFFQGIPDLVLIVAVDNIY